MEQAQGLKLGKAAADSLFCVSPTTISCAPVFVHGSPREVHFGCYLEPRIAVLAGLQQAPTSTIFLCLRGSGSREEQEARTHHNKPRELQTPRAVLLHYALHWMAGLP